MSLLLGTHKYTFVRISWIIPSMMIMSLFIPTLLYLEGASPGPGR